MGVEREKKIFRIEGGRRCVRTQRDGCNLKAYRCVKWGKDGCGHLILK